MKPVNEVGAKNHIKLVISQLRLLVTVSLVAEQIVNTLALFGCLHQIHQIIADIIGLNLDNRMRICVERHLASYHVE